MCLDLIYIFLVLHITCGIRLFDVLLIEGRLQPRGARGLCVDALACRRLGDLVGCGWAFLVWRPPQFTYASRMRCRGGVIRRRAPQAAWHTVSLTSIVAVGKPAVFESLWAPRLEQTPPHQPYPAHVSGTSLLTAASRRLARGDRAGATAPGFATAWRLSPLLSCSAF